MPERFALTGSLIAEGEMMMELKYSIRKIAEGTKPGTDALSKAFGIPEGLECAAIDSYVWDINGYKPVCGAYVGWNEQGLHVWLAAPETEVRPEVTECGGPVCTDSCLEFFFNPDPDTVKEYLNAECSPRPCMHLGCGEGRGSRTVYRTLPTGIQPVTQRDPQLGWCVHYVIPQSFLRETFGVTLHAGLRMAGNFYKCGDLTPFPHYGTWAPIDPVAYPNPDFHRPEYFRPMVLTD